MSRASGPNDLGELRIGVTADTTQGSRALEDLGNTAEKTEQSIGRSMLQSVGHVGKLINQVLRITAIIGVVYKLVEAFSALDNQSAQTAANVEGVRQGLEDLNVQMGIASSNEQLESRLRKVNEQYDKLNESLQTSSDPAVAAQYERNEESRARALAETRNKFRREQEKKEEESAKKAIENALRLERQGQTGILKEILENPVARRLFDEQAVKDTVDEFDRLLAESDEKRLERFKRRLSDDDALLKIDPSDVDRMPKAFQDAFEEALNAMEDRLRKQSLEAATEMGQKIAEANKALDRSIKELTETIEREGRSRRDEALQAIQASVSEIGAVLSLRGGVSTETRFIN